jgi:actin-related protein
VHLLILSTFLPPLVPSVGLTTPEACTLRDTRRPLFFETGFFNFRFYAPECCFAAHKNAKKNKHTTRTQNNSEITAKNANFFVTHQQIATAAASGSRIEKEKKKHHHPTTNHLFAPLHPVSHSSILSLHFFFVVLLFFKSLLKGWAAPIRAPPWAL